MKARRLTGSIAVCAAMLTSMRAQQARPEDFARELKDHHYQKVLVELKPFLAAHPNDPLLWTVRGLALRGLGRSSDSIVNFEKALKADPNFIPALEGASETSYGSGDPRAAGFLRRLLKLQPANETANAMAGTLAYEQHHCAAAVSFFETSQEQIYDNEIVASQFSDCLLQLNRADEAVRVLGRALSLHPGSVNLRYNLAVAQLKDNRPAETIATLQLLIGPGKSSASVLNLLASAQVTLGRLDQATASLSEAISLAPEMEDNYVDLGILCLENQQDLQALQIAASGLRFVQTSWRLYTVHGIASSLLSNYEDAEADFERSLQLEPLNSASVAARSILYAHTDQPEKAISALRQKLRSTPNNPMLNYLLADALIRNGGEPTKPQFEEARRALLRSLRANPNSSDALTLLGKLYVRENSLDQAEQTLKRAVDCDPTNRAALNQLLVVFRKLGRREESFRIAQQLTALLNKGGHGQPGEHTGDDFKKASQ